MKVTTVHTDFLTSNVSSYYFYASGICYNLRVDTNAMKSVLGPADKNSDGTFTPICTDGYKTFDGILTPQLAFEFVQYNTNTYNEGYEAGRANIVSTMRKLLGL